MRNRSPFGGPLPSFPMHPGIQAPGPPISSGQPQGNYQEFSSSAILVDGQSKVLCNLKYERPRPITVFVTAPILNQPSDISNIGFVTDSADSTVELWILGEVLMGVGGTSFSFNFDVPFEQMAQFSAVVESLKLTARLYVKPIPVVGAGPGLAQSIDEAAFINPPFFQGTPNANVFVQGLGGTGISGLSNVMRRARFHHVHTTATCAIPTLASMFKLMGEPGITYIEQALGAGPVNLSYGPYSSDAPDRPIVTGCERIQATVGMTADVDMEFLYRLGLSGFPS